MHFRTRRIWGFDLIVLGETKMYKINFSRHKLPSRKQFSTGGYQYLQDGCSLRKLKRPFDRFVYLFMASLPQCLHRKVQHLKPNTQPNKSPQTKYMFMERLGL